MTIFSVEHTTIYRYKNPVRPGLHTLLFRPRDSFDQRLIESHLEVSPKPAQVRWIHDVFGNCITLLDFAVKTTVLQFETFIRLEHTPENAPDFRIEDYARNHHCAYAEEELPDLREYMQRQYSEEKGVEHWLETFVASGTEKPTGQLLMTLNQAISQSFSYKRR